VPNRGALQHSSVFQQAMRGAANHAKMGEPPPSQHSRHSGTDRPRGRVPSSHLSSEGHIGLRRRDTSASAVGPPLVVLLPNAAREKSPVCASWGGGRPKTPAGAKSSTVIWPSVAQGERLSPRSKRGFSSVTATAQSWTMRALVSRWECREFCLCGLVPRWTRRRRADHLGPAAGPHVGRRRSCRA